VIDFIAAVIALYAIVAGFLFPAIAAVVAYHLFTHRPSGRLLDPTHAAAYNGGKHAARG
jgi:hypothetical protein